LAVVVAVLHAAVAGAVLAAAASVAAAEAGVAVAVVDSAAAAADSPAAARREAGDVIGAFVPRLFVPGGARTMLLAALTIAGTVASANATAQTPIPELQARITDLTATLSVDQIATLDGELAALETRKGAQIGVLMLATLTPPADVPATADDIETFATHVFERWKLGRKGVDDGVLLIVVKNDHKVRIEVGYGLEGAIPDAAAARIIREYITPRFREGDYYAGIHDATTTLGKLIDGESLPAPLEGAHAPATLEPEVLFWWSMFGIVFASLMLGFILAVLLKSVFNVFPIRIIPIGARRAIGLLAGPSIIATLVWWAAGHGSTLAVSPELAFGASHFAVAGAITGWLGWHMAPEGASKVWAGGMTWKELPRLIFDLTVGMFFSGFSGGVVSVGGSSSGGGFSGGGGSSGGGGASGSW
jgi:uncharacterized protein